MMKASNELGTLNGMDISGLLNVQKVHDNLYSSGQPTSAQLEILAQAGVSVIVNLALNNHTSAQVADARYSQEDRTVLELGMQYIQVPILWDCPEANSALFALKAIYHLHTQLVWVHCNDNKCAASLMYLYRRFYMHMAIDEAQDLLHQVWEPDETWSGLINAVAMQLQTEQQQTELMQATV